MVEMTHKSKKFEARNFWFEIHLIFVAQLMELLKRSFDGGIMFIQAVFQKRIKSKQLER